MPFMSSGKQYSAMFIKYSVVDPFELIAKLHPIAAASRLTNPGVSNQLGNVLTLHTLYN